MEADTEDNTLKISMNNFRERLFYIFFRYWDSDQFTNMTFHCEGGDQVKAHKFIVTSASKFMKIVLNSSLPDEHSSVYLPEVSSRHLKYLLQVIYTGTVELPERDIEQTLQLAKLLKFDLGLGNFGETKDEKSATSKPKERSKCFERNTVETDPEQLLAALTDEITVTSQSVDSKESSNFSILYQSILNNFPNVAPKTSEIKSEFDFFSPTPAGFVDRTRDFSCRLCGLELRHHKQLSAHFLQTHPGENAFECGICMKENREYANHKSHMATHDPNEEWQCSECGNSFPNVVELKTHRAEAHGEDANQANAKSNYPCPDCPEQFGTLGAFRRHRTSHTGQRPYPCPQLGCDKGFHTRFHLSRHMRLHTGVKPFPCPLCPYRCNQKPNLRIHMRHRHKIEIPSQRRRTDPPTVIENNIYIGGKNMQQLLVRAQGFATDASNFIGPDIGGTDSSNSGTEPMDLNAVGPEMDADVSSTFSEYADAE